MRHHQTEREATKARQAGFGLAEVVIVVAVLGVLTAIVVPAMASVSDNANAKRCQRIAQEFASLSNFAVASGSEELIASTSVAEALDQLVKGVSGTGVFADTIYRLPNVTLADQNEAAHHLELRDSVLIYNPKEP